MARSRLKARDASAAFLSSRVAVAEVDVVDLVDEVDAVEEVDVVGETAAVAEVAALLLPMGESYSTVSM